MELKDIKLDPHNYRKHNEKNKELIKRSLKECGFGRSILIDSEGVIIAGNGVFSQVPKDTKMQVIQTYGDELIAIQRMDLKTQDRARKELAKNDNLTSDTSENDLDELLVDFTREELKEWGVDVGDVDEATKNPYTEKINIPQYDVVGEKPTVKELYNDEKCNALAEEIENSKLSEDEKKFLLKAATRHIVFNYRNIAEFYAGASKECQELMERSALVIIDYDDAIKNGYTELNEGLNEVLADEGE